MAISWICLPLYVIFVICCSMYPCDSFVRTQNFNLVRYFALKAHADLTPAFDKFPLAPETKTTISANAIKTSLINGPDPFEYVASELLPLQDEIREVLKTENPLLSNAAVYFFDKVAIAN